jgi:hypothetical protein
MLNFNTMGLLLAPFYCVAGSYNGEKMQIKVCTNDGEIVQEREYTSGSPVIAEYLGAVLALALLKRAGTFLPVYLSNTAAIKWIQDRAHNSTAEVSEDVQIALEKANAFLQTQSDPRLVFVFKWITKEWGKSPAFIEPENLTQKLF